MIPNNVSKENIVNAIDEIDRKGIPEKRQSEKYFLVYNDFLYPPKYVISIANRYANKTELASIEFSGGLESNTFLEGLGFELVEKPAVREGQKWLVVTSENNWNKCLENRVWGADDNRSQQIKKMEMNDEIVVYTVGMKLAAICRVSSKYYFDETKIWEDGTYPHRVKIEPILIPTDPCDIKKLYSVYLGYKRTPGEYFGQVIRPISMNEFSIFQSELARSMNKLIKWDGRADKSDFALEVKSYLENKFSIELTKIRGHLYFQSGTNLHVRGSKKHSDGTGFYYLQQEDYEDAIKNNNSFFAVVLDSVDTTFIIPSIRLKEIFDANSLVEPHQEKPKWYFEIFNKEEKYFLRVHNSSSKPFEIENYLNNWKQISELRAQIETKVIEDKPELSISGLFIMGYDDENSKISKKSQILMWVEQCDFLLIDSLFFVFNNTTLKLESCFRFDKYRNVILIKDELNVPLQEINKISPFDKEHFQDLVRSDFPTNLNYLTMNKVKYAKFKNFLLDLVRPELVHSLINYWIFTVTDKLPLLAKEIYNTRMGDNFWGLNQDMPYRKKIKKGDKVIFCEGTREFLGTAIIDSDVFQLTNEQKDEASHDKEIYGTDYGVKLTELSPGEKIHIGSNKLGQVSFAQVSNRKIDFARIGDHDQYIEAINTIFAKPDKERTDLEKAIINTIEIFGMIDDSTPLHIKFLLSVISLESLLMGGKQDAIGYKLAERVTLLVANSKNWIKFYSQDENIDPQGIMNHKLEINKMITKLYDRRSGFAHKGTTNESNSALFEDFNSASQIFRYVFFVILDLYDKGKGILYRETRDQFPDKSLEEYIKKIKYRN